MEQLFSIAFIALFSIIIFKLEMLKQPLVFEKDENKKSKYTWFDWYIIRAIIIVLFRFSKLLYAESSSYFFIYLIDILLYGALIYLFSVKDKNFFKLIYVLIPLETWALSQNHSETSYSLYVNTIVYFLVWGLPNYIYFIKRRNYFSTNTPENSTTFEQETDYKDSVPDKIKTHKKILPTLSNFLHIFAIILYVIARHSVFCFLCIYTL